MIKRIIFDIDNTLIPWKDEYSIEIKNALDELRIKYSEQDYLQIKKAIDEYENNYFTYNRELIVKFVNEYTKKQYPKELVYRIIERWIDCHPKQVEDGIIKTLSYLSSKYEMVILTDWFIDVQTKKLEKLGILKYFTKIYSAENVKRKPFKEAFLKAKGRNKPEECIMIGDSIERDIEGALNAGLQAIWYNPNGIHIDINCKEINKIEDLINIL